MRQLSLFAESEGNWSSDNWQTPDVVAIAMSQLIKDSDRAILEPCAGSGQIAKQLPLKDSNRKIVCCEINSDRYRVGTQAAPKCTWYDDDYFGDIAERLNWENSFDLIIGNPPFSNCVEFIARSLPLLNQKNADARILFLLPLDWNCSHKRANEWKRLNAHIHHEYRWQGRIAYLDGDGVAQSRRQVCDAVFDLRLGSLNSVVSYL